MQRTERRINDETQLFEKTYISKFRKGQEVQIKNRSSESFVEWMHKKNDFYDAVAKNDCMRIVNATYIDEAKEWAYLVEYLCWVIPGYEGYWELHCGELSDDANWYLESELEEYKETEEEKNWQACLEAAFAKEDE